MYLPLSILDDLDSVRVIAINEMQKQPSPPEIGVGVGRQEQGDISSGVELESANNTMTASIPKASLSKQKQEESGLVTVSNTKREMPYEGVHDTAGLKSISNIEPLPNNETIPNSETVPNIESITDNIEPIPDKETQVAPEIEQWNAADYLYVSTRLAKIYPEVPESKMVRNMDVVHR